MSCESNKAQSCIACMAENGACLNDGVVPLPTDADGIPIMPGDRLLLAHNGKEVTVRSVELRADGWIVWPAEGGGGFGMPACRANVTHAEG